MAESILVFISHSSEDKSDLVDPIVEDLESCYIRTWVDTKRIAPGDNLRQSILKDGLEKADIVLIFFTQKSLKSSWVDREIKHVLNKEMKKDRNFDLSKVISIFDSEKTYDELSERYPELTDELLHLMPPDYDKLQLAQLVSAIWSKHLSLQGVDLEVEKQLLDRDREIFKKDQYIASLEAQLSEAMSKDSNNFEALLKVAGISNFLSSYEAAIGESEEGRYRSHDNVAVKLGLSDHYKVYENPAFKPILEITAHGREFIKWLTLNKTEEEITHVIESDYAWLKDYAPY